MFIRNLVQFSLWVVSSCLWPLGQQHTGHPCPSPTPGVCSNSVHHVVMPSNHLILCCPLLILPSIFSRIRVFSNELALQVAKVLELQFQHQSLQWIFRTDFLQDWLVGSPWGTLKGTLKSLLQHHNSKASTLHHSAFFMIQHFHD